MADEAHAAGRRRRGHHTDGRLRAEPAEHGEPRRHRADVPGDRRVLRRGEPAAGRHRPGRTGGRRPRRGHPHRGLPRLRRPRHHLRCGPSREHRARLELTSALGDEYVVLEPPPGARGGATLADAATIPLERTSRGPDVEHTLAALGTLLTGSGIDQVRTIVSEVNTALGGRTGEVKRLVHDLDSVLGSLDRRSGEIVGVIDSMHALSRRLAEGTPALEAALTDIRPALQVLLDERERFTTLLGNVGSLGTAAQGLLDKTGTALTEQLDQLRPVLRDLESLDGKLGPTLTALKDFADLVQRATPGDYLNLDGTIDVPLTVAELLDPDLGAAAPATARPEPGGLGDLLGGGAR
ncbi:MCE family protein [Prauserella oleivorans]